MATQPRLRSEYRIKLPSALSPASAPVLAGDIARFDSEATAELAALLLDAYRGSVDDEGETMVEALEAAEHSVSFGDPDHRWAIREEGRLIAVCFVVHVDEVPYIDPIVVASSHKRQRLGVRFVAHVLGLLHQSGASEVGATITDGNVASERLFASLGAQRVGPWPPTAG